MNSRLPLIALLTLLIFGSRWISNQNQTLLGSSTQFVPSTLSFNDWMGCRTKQSASHECQTTSEYYAAVNKFSALTYADSPTITSACDTFDTYWNTSEAEFPLNKSNTYSDCYLTEEVQNIAKANTCFYTYYYLPHFVTCAGVNQEVKVDQVSTSTYSIFDWATCYANIHLTNTDACQATDAYNSVASKVYALTQNGFATQLSACNSFYTYFEKTSSEQPLNFNNFFKDCFLSTQVLEIAKSNTCFYEMHFAPLYVNCSGK